MKPKASEVAKSLLLECGLGADMNTPNKILARAYLRLREAAERVCEDQGETWWLLESVLGETDET